MPYSCIDPTLSGGSLALLYDRDVAGKSAQDGGNDGVGAASVAASVADGSGGCDIESCPAEGGSVGPDDQFCVQSGRASTGCRLDADIEDVDPVARVGFVVVKQAPGAIGVLKKFRSAEEGLPGVPHRLGERERAPRQRHHAQ